MGIGGLDDFLPQRAARVSAEVVWPQVVSPQDVVKGTNYLAPGDLATIYDFQTLHTAGTDGTGQKIVVTGASDPLLSDVETYRSNFDLPAIKLQTILTPGFSDPGTNSDLAETDLDLDIVGAVAPNASLLYVYSTNFFNALIYAVDQNLAPVINASSYIGCDATETAANMMSFRAIAQQANALGITWVNSSGDNGPAGCDVNGAACDEGTQHPFPGGHPGGNRGRGDHLQRRKRHVLVAERYRKRGHGALLYS